MVPEWLLYPQFIVCIPRRKMRKPKVSMPAHPVQFLMLSHDFHQVMLFYSLGPEAGIAARKAGESGISVF